LEAWLEFNWRDMNITKDTANNIFELLDNKKAL
jgi:hypothetical protein